MPVMTVTCPPGKSSGMTIPVNTGDGVRMVEVPPGVKQGMPFEFSYTAHAAPSTWHDAATVVIKRTEGAQRVGAWKMFEPGPEAWQAGHAFECFDDMEACCLGTFCPCVLLCRAAELMKQGPRGIPQATHEDPQLESLTARCFTQCLAFWCPACVMCLAYRELKIREAPPV
ncbi:MAG: hypothetical protein SGPRY_010369, partial [Prymnesium sp.]